jgi:RNA polymerase sigma factor (sigma-70 family)
MCQNSKADALINKPDVELIKLVKHGGNDDAFLEVCRRYENIFYKVCQKYTSALTNSGVNPQDIFEEKNCIIFHCILTFKSNKKTKLGTWIGNYARYLCLNSINARRFILPSNDDELKQFIEETQTSHEYFENTSSSKEDFKYVLNILEQVKDYRIIQVFHLRYLSPKRMIWAEIAKKIGVSTQTVINLHNKGLSILKKKMKSKNISDVI